MKLKLKETELTRSTVWTS